MRCKDIQRILTAGLDDGTGGVPGAEARRHLAACPECVAFAADLARIRDRVRTLPKPDLPAALDARTRRTIEAALSPAARPQPLPKGIGAVLAALTALTVLVVFPLVWTGEIAEPLTFRTAAAIALLLQNGVMLLVAPILFRKFGARAGAPRIES
jgi:anti-sigma factor RsiW